MSGLVVCHHGAKRHPRGGLEASFQRRDIEGERERHGHDENQNAAVGLEESGLRVLLESVEHGPEQPRHDPAGRPGENHEYAPEGHSCEDEHTFS